MVSYAEYEYDLSVLQMSHCRESPSLKEVKNQFKKLSKQLHPDKHPNEDPQQYTEMFQELLNCYMRLSKEICEDFGCIYYR